MARHTASGRTPVRIHPVILAGGRGTRLRPLTDVLPKPLIPIDGRPLLWYAIGLTPQSTFERPIVLTDYKHELIRAYFSTEDVEFRWGAAQSITEGILAIALETEGSALLGLSSDTLLPRSAVISVVRAYRRNSLDAVLFARQPRRAVVPWNFRIDDGRITDLTMERSVSSLYPLLVLFNISSLRRVRDHLAGLVSRRGALAPFDIGWLLLLRAMVEMGIPVRARIDRVPFVNVNTAFDLQRAERFVARVIRPR